jgi:hypothetical protein
VEKGGKKIGAEMYNRFGSTFLKGGKRWTKIGAEMYNRFGSTFLKGGKSWK